MASIRLSRRNILASALATGCTGLIPRRSNTATIPFPAEPENYIDWSLCTVVQEEHAKFQAEFSGWFGVAEGRFARPVEVIKQASSTTLHVPGLHPALTIDSMARAAST